MSSLRSVVYETAVKALMADPIIIEMAEEIRSRGDRKYTEAPGFVMSAVSEYMRRGGQIIAHIGGPSEAIINLLSGEEGEEQ